MTLHEGRIGSSGTDEHLRHLIGATSWARRVYLEQTGWKDREIAADNCKEEMISRISGFDWDKIIADVCPFIERQQDLQMLIRDNMVKLLKS